HSAISMLACFLGLAVIYLRLAAPFLAAIHVLVYTGAILVLFLFVIMLLNLKPDELGVEYSLKTRGAIALLCGALFALVALPLWQDQRPLPKDPPPGFGSVEQVGNALFNDYALPFELISVLPLIGFLINGMLRLPKSAAGIAGCAGPIASFGLSLAAFAEVHHHGAICHKFFTWISAGDLVVPFGLSVDALSAVMLLVVTGVGSLIHIYSISYM